MTDQSVTTCDSSVGNTNSTSPPQKPRAAQYRAWCFTWNNPPCDNCDTIFQSLTKVATKVCIGEEHAPKTGTRHFQGYLYFTNGRSLVGVKRLLDPKVHLEPAKGSHEQNLTYCSKEKLIFKWGFQDHVEDPMIGKDLKEWQKNLLRLYQDKPDGRSVVWIHGPPASGKTSFIKHLVLKGETLVVGGKREDIFYAVAEWVASGKPLKLVVIALPMAADGMLSWQAIEMLKDGMFFSGKYKGGMCIFNSPHVWITANQYPDNVKIATDRLKTVDTEINDF